MTFKEMREKLTPDLIKKVLLEYGVDAVYENTEYIIFPTCCHNAEILTASPKLYYYINTGLFMCYTECNDRFDVFDLIIKMEYLRGNEVDKMFAIKRLGFSGLVETLTDASAALEISHMYQLNHTKPIVAKDIQLEVRDIQFLDNRFSFDLNGLKTWTEEGITPMTLLNYRITYDPVDNAIIIPHFDAKGNVVGVRGRYLNDDAFAKYKPIEYNQISLAHPKNKTLYGFSHNISALKQTKTAIIFEGEKSVLKMDSLYGTRNIAVAICGKTISEEHLALLLDVGVGSIILALDADYTNEEEREKKKEEYKKIGKTLDAYFNVSIIIDNEGLLGYKDSPIDKGLETFTTLMRERFYL